MNKAVRTVGFIAFATFLSKAMGMMRDVILAHEYGTSALLDAYMAASRIPVLFFDFTLGAAIVSTFIPVFNSYLRRDEKVHANDFANSFINLVLAVSAFFAIVGMVFSGFIVGVTAPGFSPEIQDITSKLLIIMLPSIVFTTLAYSMVGILQSNGEYNIPAIISLVSNTVVIIYLVFLNKRFGIYGVAVAMLIGWALQAVVQVPSLIKKKFRYKFILDLKNEGIKDVFLLAVPVLISTWLQPICVLINTIFASFLETGSVAALELANRLYIIVTGIFVFAITNYIFPSLSRLSEKRSIPAFVNVMKKSLASMLVIIAPIAAGMMLLSKEIILIVYARGQFDEKSVAFTSTALFFYCIGMLPFGVNEILGKCFYALQDGKTPMVSTIFGIITAVLFAFITTRFFHMGIGGLALSASIAVMVVSVLLIYKMNKGDYKFINKNAVIFSAKIALAVLLCTGGGAAAKNLTARFGVWVQTFTAVLAAAVIYAAFLYLFKIEKYLKGAVNNG
ncbi:MAG: murein biosynthesis integral membrane protein MurJ [Firmicutes bacterium]|nr:murein biosynthesis integral membrane protein MurJ [Bacillota bacterium]